MNPVCSHIPSPVCSFATLFTWNFKISHWLSHLTECFFFCILSLERNTEHILTCWIQHSVSISMGSLQIPGNQATGRCQFNYASCLSTNSQFFLQLSHKCRSSKSWWGQKTFDHLTSEETSIWSDHITYAEFKWSPSSVHLVDGDFFSPFLSLSLSLLASQRWRWTADMKTWPSCIIKTVAVVTPAREPAELCGHHAIETPTIWSPMFTQGTGYLHFTGRNHMRWGLPFWSSIYSDLIIISLADLRFSSLYLDWNHLTNRITGCHFFTEDFQTLA